MNDAIDPLRRLKPLAGRALEQVLARVLVLDPDTQAALAALNGRQISLHLQAPPLALAIRVEDGALRVGPVDAEREPDLSIKTTLGGLLAQLPFAREQSGSGNVGRLRMAGDAELAQRLQKLVRDFNPDWDRPFVAVFGEIAGVQIARALRAALATGLAQTRTLVRDAADWLSEEVGVVASRTDLEIFNEAVDTLRDDVERIASRIERLQARLPEQN